MTEPTVAGPVPIIAGLYFHVRGGVRQTPRMTLSEIASSLEANPWYRDRLLVLAGDEEAASLLTGLGLRVHSVFADAPPEIHYEAAHRMKHWMCLWALRTFGEFLWVDWDTVALREPDQEFWAFCRTAGTPKFIRIRNYWATVNCGSTTPVPRGRSGWSAALGHRSASRTMNCSGVPCSRSTSSSIRSSGGESAP